MTYQKFQATQLFTGTEMLGENFVLVTDEQGRIEDIVTIADAGENIQKLDGVLSPGFINCHCHLELSHMKGLIPEETGLVDFVFKVVNGRHFPDEEILDAITKAENEMLTNGIVGVGDICNNTLTLSQKQKQNLAYYNFIEVSGWIPSVADIRFERSLGFYHSFKQLQTPGSRLQTSLSPHAPYSVSNELWDLISPYFKTKTVTIHNQETGFEDSLFENGEGDFTRMYGMMKMDTSFF
ncbi:MAG: amidohydrolase, partial [Sediminibacterium sp.]